MEIKRPLFLRELTPRLLRIYIFASVCSLVRVAVWMFADTPTDWCHGTATIPPPHFTVQTPLILLELWI
jgi:hypothetical protein